MAPGAGGRGPGRHAALLERARGYPYEAPAGSYTFQAGTVHPFEPRLARGRTAVLAIGSNRSPRRLAEKFGGTACIPVERARLAGHDVVYSAHVASYGAVPAMLHRCPGTVVEVAVTWLGAAQLQIMHASETAAANYRFAELEGLDLRLDGGARLATAGAYLSCHRPLVDGDGSPLALAALRCRGRRHRALDTAAALEVARRHAAPGADPDGFVIRLVEDPGFRRATVRALAARGSEGWTGSCC